MQAQCLERMGRVELLLTEPSQASAHSPECVITLPRATMIRMDNREAYESVIITSAFVTESIPAKISNPCLLCSWSILQLV